MSNKHSFNPYLPGARVRSILSGLALLGLTGGCHLGRPIERPPGADQYLIVGAELDASRQKDLYDAVKELRPNWFTRSTARRGTAEQNIVVYVDDRLMGNTTTMRRFAPNYPARIRYLTATDAQVKYGQQNGMRAAIVIETERP